MYKTHFCFCTLCTTPFAPPYRVASMDATAEYTEVMLKHKGQVKRTALKRVSYAECTDDECPNAWSGPAAIGAAVKHVIGTGHTVRASYEAAFEYAPADPEVTITQVEPDIPAIAEQLRALPVSSQKNRSKVTPKKD